MFVPQEEGGAVYDINPEICVKYSDTNVTNPENLQGRSRTLMESHELSRYFEFNGVRLPDINSKLSVEEIRAAYAHQFPDIATATITGPEAVGDKLRYLFSRAIGVKG